MAPPRSQHQQWADSQYRLKSLAPECELFPTPTVLGKRDKQALLGEDPPPKEDRDPESKGWHKVRLAKKEF